MFEGIKSWFIKENPVAKIIVEQKLGQPIWTDVAKYNALSTAGYKSNVYVFACIDKIAKACGGIDWLLYNNSSNKDGKTEITKHPLLSLIKRPNPLQGQSKFIQDVFGYLKLSGNSFILKVGPENKPPLELYALRPDRMQVIAGTTLGTVSGYKYKIGANEVSFKPEEILHLKTFNPTDDFLGMSPGEPAGKSLDQSNMSKSWNVSLLQNSARPPGVLKTEQNLNDAQFNRLENKWYSKYAGYKNAGTPPILEGGLSWQSMGLSPADMEWLEGQKLSAREIAIALSVPPELIGDNSNKTYSNYKEARSAFYEETILPDMDWFKDELNNWLTPLYGENLYLDYDKDDIEALQEDRNDVWKRVMTSNWLTVNEKRVATGYDERDDGDVILVNGTLVSLDALGDSSENNNANTNDNIDNTDKVEQEGNQSEDDAKKKLKT